MAKDKNGYTKSLLLTEQDTCYICGRDVETARHEIYGASNRQISKALGMWVNVCPKCHELIHNNPIKYEWLKVAGQLAFEREYGHDRFIECFGRNYLEVEQWITCK